MRAKKHRERGKEILDIVTQQEQKKWLQKNNSVTPIATAGRNVFMTFQSKQEDKHLNLFGK